MDSVISVAAMLGSFMALLLAAFLFVVPSRIRLANCLLALFLTATAVDISAWFIGEWWAANPAIANFRPVIAMLQMPFFTGFIWFSCFQERRLHAWDFAHFLPGLIVIVFVATDTPMPWLRPLFELQYFVYISAAIFILWRFNQLLTARFVKRSPGWRWLALLVASSLLAHSFFIMRTLLSPNLPTEISMMLQVIAALLVLTITLWIAFQALLKPELFRGGDQLLASAANSMNDDTAEEHERLIAYMEEQRPYLDADLSLTRLARRTEISAKKLSALINQRHGLHFFDFINDYRINHAKKMLIESERSIADIIYASGFNAKSSFNTAFRKHTGTTPSAYRRDHAEK